MTAINRIATAVPDLDFEADYRRWEAITTFSFLTLQIKKVKKLEFPMLSE